MKRIIFALAFLFMSGCSDLPEESPLAPEEASARAIAGSLCARIPDQVVPEILKVPVYWEGSPVAASWGAAQFYLEFPPGIVDYDCPQWWEDRWGGCNVAEPGSWLQDQQNAELFGNPHGDYRYICMFFWVAENEIPDGAHIADIYVPLNENADLAGLTTEWRVYGAEGDFEGAAECTDAVRFCAPTDRRCGRVKNGLAANTQ